MNNTNAPILLEDAKTRRMRLRREAVAKRTAQRTYGHGLYKNRENYIAAKLSSIADKENAILSNITSQNEASCAWDEIRDIDDM